MLWIIISLVGLALLLIGSIVVIVVSKKEIKAIKEEIKQVSETANIKSVKKVLENRMSKEPSEQEIVVPPLQPQPQPQPQPQETVIRRYFPATIPTAEAPTEEKTKKYFIQPWQSQNDKKWRFRIKHINGNIILSSPPYSSKQAMYDTIEPISKEMNVEIR